MRNAPQDMPVSLVQSVASGQLGAAIAALMAAAQPKSLRGLVLLSGYFGESGPTAKWLVDWGSKLLPFIPRDLKNAVREVAGQPSQLAHLHAVLDRVRTPLHILHGDADDFAPIETAERFHDTLRDHRAAKARFRRVPGADHFLNDRNRSVDFAVMNAKSEANHFRRDLRLSIPSFNNPSFDRFFSFNFLKESFDYVRAFFE